MSARKDTLYLVDGTYNIFRAYHARGVPEMRTRDGRPTKATFIFTRILLSLLDHFSPRWLGVALDPEGQTLRHEEYERYVREHPEAASAMAGYKATRPETPADLLEQFPLCRQVCEGLRLPILESAGYEADDVLGGLARQASSAGMDVMLVTADKDLFQLVDERVKILNPHKENLVMDPEVVEREFGVRPGQVPDVLALMGDTSDNIPGVPGIGEKGARELIRRFGSLEDLLGRLDEIARPAQRETLRQNAERARLSRELARIRTDVPVALDLEALEVRDADRPALQDLFGRLEFRSLQERFKVAESAPEYAPPERKTETRRIERADDLPPLARELASAGSLTVRLEPAGPEERLGEGLPPAPGPELIAGIAVSPGPGTAVYVPLGHRYLGAPDPLPWPAVAETLGAVLANPAVGKIVHNAKREQCVLRKAGLPMAGLAFDTQIAAWMLEPDRRSYALEGLVRDELGETIEPSPPDGSGEVETDRASASAGARAEATGRLATLQRERLRAEGLEALYEHVELPLIPVLSAMEAAGVRIDVGYLKALSDELRAEMDRLIVEAHRHAGREFNLDSPIQLRKVLFEEIGLKPVGRTMKTRAFSTRDEDLEELAGQHPLPGVIRDYRAVSKLRSTYAEALPRLVRPATGRVHASFNQTGAASGRLSSSDPNLQNIPIRTELGRKIRRGILPEPGWRLISADYSQIELRVLAHAAQDPAFVEAFRAGEDIHRSTAARIFNREYEQVTTDERRAAKTVNFGILYGMSDFGLSRELAISRDEARRFILAYFTRFAAVRRYIDQTMAAAEQTAETRTLFDRRRRFPDVRSSNYNVRQQSLRAAVNHTIQGSAADLIKMAMVGVHARLQREGRAARLLIQVHDELVLEAPPAESAAIQALLREEMSGVGDLSVPLDVDVREGDNWLEAK